MNELREIYNIEMTDKEKTILAGSNIMKKINEIEKGLELTTNTEERIGLLKLKASLEYAIVSLYDVLGNRSTE